MLGLVKEAKSITSGLDGLKIQFKNTQCLHAYDLQILITIIVIKALSQLYYNPLYEFCCVIPVYLDTNLTYEVWFRMLLYWNFWDSCPVFVWEFQMLLNSIIVEFFVVFMLEFLHENFMHFGFHEFSTVITHFIYCGVHEIYLLWLWTCDPTLWAKSWTPLRICCTWKPTLEIRIGGQL